MVEGEKLSSGSDSLKQMLLVMGRLPPTIESRSLWQTLENFLNMPKTLIQMQGPLLLAHMVPGDNYFTHRNNDLYKEKILNIIDYTLPIISDNR
jgi:hypothetical protein